MFRFIVALSVMALVVASAPAQISTYVGAPPINGSLNPGDGAYVPPSDSRAAASYHRDAYSFPGQPGQRVQIDLTSNFDGYLILFDANYNEVARNDDFGGTRASRIDTTLSGGGQHVVIITSFSSGTTGTYTLTLTGSGGGGGVVTTGDTPISMGQSLSGHLNPGDGALLAGESRGAPGYNRDGYSFYGSAGQAVRIDATFSNFDGYLYLVGPAGSTVDSDDDNTSTRDAQISTNLPQSGNYRIVVTTFSSGATGSYTVSLNSGGGGGGFVSGDIPISFGQSLSGSLNPGDSAVLAGDARGASGYNRDGFSFYGQPGMAVQADVAYQGFDGYLYLVGPSGNVVERNDDFGGTRSSRIDTMLMQGGTHRIVVTSYSSGATGAYTLTLTGGGGGGIGIISSGDTPISLGQSLSGSLSPGDSASLPASDSRAGPSYHRDGFSFYGNAGQAVQIDTTYSGFDGYLLLVDPFGSVVERNDDFGGTGSSRIAATLSASGTYRIVLTSYGTGATGGYSLSLNGGGGGGGVIIGSSTDTPISMGQSLSGHLNHGDSAPLIGESRGAPRYNRDGYSFYGNAGASVQIDATYSGFDGYLYLVGPTGNTVAYDDDGTSTSNSRISTNLPQSGNYRIVVTTYGSGSTGAYTVSLNGGGGIVAPSSDTPISFGQSLSGSLNLGDSAPLTGEARGGASYNRDGYSFYGNAGASVQIDAIYSGFDGYLYLVGPTGNTVAYDDDGTSTSNSRISTNLPQSGTYRIVVTTYSSGRTGGYTVSLNGGGGGGGGGPLDFADSAISRGQTINGALVPGDSASLPGESRGAASYNRDGYTFYGSAGQTVDIDLNSDFDGYLYLLDPYGNLVESNDDFGSTRRSRMDPTLNASGTYRIVVTSFSSGATGTYTLSLR